MAEDMPDFCADLPLPLRTAGFYSSDGEGAWPREAALGVIEHLGGRRCAVIGIDVWVPRREGPLIPFAVQGWDAQAERERDREPWDDFARRLNEAASEYIRTFAWAPENAACQLAIPFFNLCVIRGETA